MPPPLDALLRDRLPPVGDWFPTHPRRAAVLCPLLQHDGIDHLVFVVRPDHLRQHPGQIAFPGGMRDGDESIAATARRECREEIGVDAGAVTLLGSLGARESSSGILVHAVVARLQPVTLQPAPQEVARILLVPWRDLQDTSRWQELPPPGGATGVQPRSSPHFLHGADRIWGLTGRFVRDLVGLAAAR
jgi:8-oxo-dGTP pyrophosphatase MutT (NUDIX family)